MPLIHSPLPYAISALEPYMSRRTLEFHHGKHHKAYVENTVAAIKGTPLEEVDLATIVKAATNTCSTTARKPGITASFGSR